MKGPARTGQDQLEGFVMRVTIERMMTLRSRAAVPVFLGAAILLSACGSPAAKIPSTTARASTAYLCQVLPRVDRLVVTRRAPTPNQFQFTFPMVVNVSNARAARQVASSACALPDFPTGVFHCPAAFAVRYHLVFAVKGEKGMGGEAIDLYPTGCPMVKGLGVVRTPRPSFYRRLARAMGLGRYDSVTFRGTTDKNG
jgi:hypothetical protein